MRFKINAKLARVCNPNGLNPRFESPIRAFGRFRAADQQRCRKVFFSSMYASPEGTWHFTRPSSKHSLNGDPLTIGVLMRDFDR